jgi:hypothetical protein
MGGSLHLRPRRAVRERRVGARFSPGSDEEGDNKRGEGVAVIGAGAAVMPPSGPYSSHDAEDQAGTPLSAGSELGGGGLDADSNGGSVDLLGLPAPGSEGVMGRKMHPAWTLRVVERRV